MLSTNETIVPGEFFRPNAPATSVGMQSLPDCGSTLGRANREPMPPASTCGGRKIGGEPPPHVVRGARSATCSATCTWRRGGEFEHDGKAASKHRPCMCHSPPRAHAWEVAHLPQQKIRLHPAGDPVDSTITSGPPARQQVHAAAQPRHSSASAACRTRAVQPREEESSAVSCQELRR